MKAIRRRTMAVVASLLILPGEKVAALLAKPEHIWLKGLTPEEAEALRGEYKERYNQ